MSAARGPRLVSLLGANTDFEARTVSLLLVAESKKTYRVPFSASCIPMIIAALVAELTKLNATLPTGETPVLQDIRGGIKVGVLPDRSAALILALQGVELPLTLSREELTNLRAGINDALMMIDRAGLWDS